jgi:hypothetical protein
MEAVGVRLGKVVLAHATESELRINENEDVKNEEPNRPSMKSYVFLVYRNSLLGLRGSICTTTF